MNNGEKTKGAPREITERRQAEQELRESNDRYQRLTENAADIIWRIDAEGRVLFVNSAVEALLGITVEEAIGLPLDQYSTEKSIKNGVKAFRKAIAEDPPCLRYSHEAEYISKSGEIIHAEVNACILLDETGNVEAIEGISRNISERKQAEENRLLLEKAIQTTQMGITITDMDGKIIFANAAEAEMHGYRPDEMIGMQARDLAPPELHRPLSVEETTRFNKWNRESLNLKKDGSLFPVRLTSSVVLSEDRTPLGVVTACEDITLLKKTERELQQAQKMEAIGNLAGGIAHDFNNLLTGILGLSNLLKLQSDPTSKTFETAKIIEGAAERASELTAQLLGFARRGKHQIIDVDINSVIHEVITLLSRTLDKNIELVPRLSTHNSFVKGDPGQMQQVLMNLAINARDAMGDGGQLVFSTVAIDIDKPFCRVHPDAAEGKYLRISVADNGHGIRPEHLPRIFEPFFTTKKDGQGSGMGLAMVYGIVKNHGGFIEVISEPEAGATFEIYLPLSNIKRSVSEGGEDGIAVKGIGRILLVDDEKIILTVGNELLKNLGYEVVTAINGRDAVDYYREHSAEIDLVILDMVMPEMGGAECFDALKLINPDLKAILSTGYGIDGRAQDIIDKGFLGFVQKPYRLYQLSNVVAEALRPGKNNKTPTPI